WAFPEETYVDALRAYFRFSREYFRRTGYRVNLLSVGYRIKEDQSSLFSYSFHGPVMTFDPVSTGNPGWEEFLRAYNELASGLGGTPLFNQTNLLTRAQVQTAFRPDRPAAERLLQGADRAGRARGSGARQWRVRHRVEAGGPRSGIGASFGAPRPLGQSTAWPGSCPRPRVGRVGARVAVINDDTVFPARAPAAARPLRHPRPAEAVRPRRPPGGHRRPPGDPPPGRLSSGAARVAVHRWAPDRASVTAAERAGAAGRAPEDRPGRSSRCAHRGGGR